MRTDEQIMVLAKKVAERTIFFAGGLHGELRGHLPAGIANKVWMEIAFLGCHIMQNKFIISMQFDERKKFEEFFKREFLNLVLNSAFLDASGDREGAMLMLEGDYDDKSNLYALGGGDKAWLFKNELKKVLNPDKPAYRPDLNLHSKETLQDKLSKAASWFGVGDKKAEGKLILPENVLDTFAQSAVKVFDAATI